MRRPIIDRSRTGAREAPTRVLGVGMIPAPSTSASPTKYSKSQMAVRRTSDGRWFAFPPRWKGPGIEVDGWDDIRRLREEHDVVEVFATADYQKFTWEFGQPPTHAN